MNRLAVFAALIALPLATSASFACEQHAAHAALPLAAAPPPPPALTEAMTKIPVEAIATSKPERYTGSYGGCHGRRSQETVYLTQ